MSCVANVYRDVIQEQPQSFWLWGGLIPGPCVSPAIHPSTRSHVYTYCVPSTVLSA